MVQIRFLTKVHPHFGITKYLIGSLLQENRRSVGSEGAMAGNYVIEGHVPLTDIERLLAEKPAIRGIAVPGMPMGSPGMEMGESRDAYDVVAFKADGTRSVFASYVARP